MFARLREGLPALVPAGRWQLRPDAAAGSRPVEPCGAGEADDAVQAGNATQVGNTAARDCAVIEGACAWADVALANAASLQALEDAHRRQRAARDAETSARTIALQLANERSRFMSTLSHDLQTPLTTLHCWLETLAMGADAMTADECRHARRTALELCDQLRRMLGEFEALRDAAAGQPAPRRQRVDLAALLQRVAERLAVAARHKGQRLVVAAPAPLPHALVDEDMVDRIVTNLVDNALRHTPAGTNVRVELEARGERVAVTVLDDGPGWPAGEGGACAQRRIGHGMGLRIVRTLLQLHDAMLRQRARDGWTTVFEFELPAVPAP